jgi:uncharacterized protein YjdB
VIALWSVTASALLGQNIISTMAGDPFKTCGTPADGIPAITAQLCGAINPTVDATGNIYYFDSGTFRIREITTDGIIHTVAGNGVKGSAGDGGPALSANLGSRLSQIAVDPAGQHLCFGDNDALKIRCVTLSTGVIQGYGTGLSAFGGAGDGGSVANASFNLLVGAVFDGNGNFYVSDSSDERVRQVNMTTMIITTFAGPGPGYCCVQNVGDGGLATQADLYQPAGLAYRNGILYIADEGNDRVRSVNLATNIINTIAGNGTPFDSGDGTAATSAGVRERWITLDTAGDLFITISSYVRMVDTNGIITTIAGSSNDGIGPDYIPALQTVFIMVDGMAWDPVAQRLLLDDGGDRMRQIFYTPATTTTLTPSENPARWSDVVSLQAAVTPADATGSVRFYWNNPYSASQGVWNFLGASPVVNGTATGSWTAPIGDATYALSAVYAGDPTHNLSQSATLSEVVQSGRSTTSVSSSANPSIQGLSVTFTATVGPVGATGTVTFLNNGVSIGSATLNSPTAVLTVSNLPAGSNSITATYSGDSRYTGSTSAVLTQTMLGVTTTTLTSGPNPAIVGAPVTLTASVKPSTASGAVQFFNGAAVLGSANLIGGQAQLIVTTLPSGVNLLTAAYGGDAGYASSASVAVSQTVNAKTVTTTVLSSSPNPSALGATVTMTVTVTPSTATGTVQFFNGATLLGSANLSGGQAQLAIATLPAGVDSLTASYSGDANNASSTSAAVSQTVNARAVTTTALTSSPNPAAYGTSVTITATVTPSAATGTVQFFNGATLLGSASLSAGKAQLKIATLPAGSDSLSAAYGGDANDLSSTSSPITETVTKVASTTKLAANPAAQSTQGQAVTFTATVTPAGATGVVQFLDGSTVLGSASLSNGTAVFSTASLGTGNHSIVAAYSGDSNVSGSQSASLSYKVKH